MPLFAEVIVYVFKSYKDKIVTQIKLIKARQDSVILALVIQYSICLH